MKNLSRQKSIFLFMHIKLLILIPILAGVQGCYSLGSTAESSEISQQKIIENVDLLESKRKDAELTALKKELAELKPSINRLLALESDFTEFLDTMQQVTLEPAVFAGRNRAETAFLSNNPSNNKPSFSKDKPLTPTLFLNAGMGEDKFSSRTSNSAQEKFSDVSVGSAKPLLNVDTQTANKFANLPEGSIEKNNDKFSTLPANSSNNLNNMLACDSITQGQGYAMHIASFKNKTSAKTLLKDLIDKVNQNDTCQREGFIANVNVDGQTFFSARIGSFPSKLDATAACNKVKKYASYCGVTKNIGEVL